MPSSLPLLPPDVDLSSLLSSVRDQGPRGTCIAFATTAAHETAIYEAIKASGAAAALTLPEGVRSFSEEVLYWGAKQADKNYSPGTSFRSAHLALGKWGQPEAVHWPYDPSRNDRDASYAPPREAIDPAHCRRGRLESVSLDAEAIKIRLASGQPVAVAVQMSFAFFQPVAGRIALPQPHELIAENHAVLLTGYQDADQIFRLRNSWGTDWGVAGYAEMPYDYLMQYGKSAYSFRSMI